MQSKSDEVSFTATQSLKPILVSVLGTVLVVSPWVIRNSLAFRTPVLNTTHGGYTLLLGNNPAFYREVVRQPHGTVWDGSHGPGQAEWLESVQQEMRDSGISGEVDEDRWMTRRAMNHIADEPGLFLQACWLRIRRFWGTTPLVDKPGNSSSVLLTLVRTSYIGLFIAFAFGLVTIIRQKRGEFVPGLLMVGSFVTVHTVFWTNTRMRAPVTPIIAVIAVLAVSSLVKQWASRRNTTMDAR